MPASPRACRIASLATLAALSIGIAACSSSNDTTGTTTPNALPNTFTATLTGAAERPNRVTTSATGTATVTFTSSVAGGPLTGGTYSVTVNGLSGAPTLSHIHAPADTNVAAGVLVNFNPRSVTTNSGTFSASFSQADFTNQNISVDSLVKLVRAGLTYVNVHTAANPAGEIRGQLVVKTQ